MPVPVGLVVHTPWALVLNPSVPAKSVRELIDLAKVSPGKLNYALPGGQGSSTHLTGEFLKLATGLDMVGVSYKDTTTALPDLYENRVQLAIAPLAADYYDQPMVAQLLRVQALLYLSTPFIAIPEAITARALDFRRPAFINLIAAIAVLALATYPVAFGQMTRLVTGLAPGDPKFQRKYYEFLRALGKRLAAKAGADQKAYCDGNHALPCPTDALQGPKACHMLT